MVTSSKVQCSPSLLDKAFTGGIGPTLSPEGVQQGLGTRWTLKIFHHWSFTNINPGSASCLHFLGLNSFP